MTRIILTLLLVVFATDASSGKYISNARVEQIIKQEKQRCPRCTAKELLIRINKRIAEETY